METKVALSYLKVVLIAVLIIAGGLLAVNQFFGWKYKAEFLQKPCGLCASLNPEVKSCIENMNNPRASYPDGKGGWTNPFVLQNVSP